MISRKQLGLLALVAACAVAPTAAPAISILDSTWKANGGTEDDPLAGFSAHMELAAEDPFSSTVRITVDHPNQTVTGTGVWVGKDEQGRDLVLTAAHVIQTGEGEEGLYVAADKITVTDSKDNDYEVAEFVEDPNEKKFGLQNDEAILVLKPSKTSLSETRSGEPILYCGGSTIPPGTEITVVGYGMLGLGSTGGNPKWPLPEKAVAAHNVIDGESWDPVEKFIPDDWKEYMDGKGEYAEESEMAKDQNFLHVRGSGSMLIYDFDSEDGKHNGTVEDSKDLRNFGQALESDPQPVDELEGYAEQGDSGGPAFAKINDTWVIVGVASFGESVGYGSANQLARPSGPLFSQNYPTIKIVDEKGESCYGISGDDGDSAGDSADDGSSDKADTSDDSDASGDDDADDDAE